MVVGGGVEGYRGEDAYSGEGGRPAMQKNGRQGGRSSRWEIVDGIDTTALGGGAEPGSSLRLMLMLLTSKTQLNVVFENAGALIGQKSLSMNLNVPTIPIIAALSVV